MIIGGKNLSETRHLIPIKCPCCGITNVYDYDICEECLWENDPVQRSKPYMVGGANEMSLLEAQTAYKNGIEIH